jgi:hypothetical protein
MSYTINLTDGALFATIADGTINTTSSMTLVGKNYAGYGQFLDTNFIHLLENASNTTAPGAPLTGQLWWDSGNGLMKVYTGTTWKTISSATASSTAPTSNVTGDLWYDTVNQQLNVYTGNPLQTGTNAGWLLVGPQFTSGQGQTGALAATILDNVGGTHTVIELYVNDSIVGIVSKDASFTPAVGISGFTTVRPGITLATTIGGQAQLFQGTATSAQTLVGYNANSFMRTDTNTSTTGTLSVLNNTGLSVGVNSDFRVSVSGNDITLRNQTTNGNLYFGANIAGTPTTVMTINGSTGAISGNQITANYADVAERFEADEALLPGTVVELGGSAEITQVNTDLSENVFGVISTRAAYLMNSNAGPDATHPPVAMTGRVPVNVVGQVLKGDRLVSAGNGQARAAQAGEATAFNVIGRALRDKLDAGPGTVEAIVTIK